MTNGNWLDFIIFIAIGIFVYLRYIRGTFKGAVLELIGFLFAIVLGLAFYSPLSHLVKVFLPFNDGFINVISLWGIMAIGYMITIKIIKTTHDYIVSEKTVVWEKYALALVSVLEAFVFLAILFAITLALPINPVIKAHVNNSRIANLFLQQTLETEIAINQSFGKVTQESLDFLTTTAFTPETDPKSLTSQSAAYGLEQLRTDTDDEKEMLRLVNLTRKQNNLSQLSFREDLVPVARAYATDMWQRKFFGHISPEGKSPVDRLRTAQVNFAVVGENLALSSSVVTAEIGLINSPKHRENILDPQYKQIGIGVISNGTQGKIFVQIFTD